MKRLLMTVALVCTCLAPQALMAGEKVVFAVPGLIIPDLPIHYAVKMGFMEKEGLDAQMLQAERRDLATLSVLSGDSIASITDPSEAAVAFQRGADLRVISGIAVNAPPFLVGDDSVTVGQESWKGKTVGLFTPPNTLYTLFMRELKKGGWEEVEKDVYRKDKGDGPDLYLRVTLGKRGTELAALLAGRSSLAVLHEPEASTAVVRGGKKKLKPFSKEFEQLLWSTLNTSGTAIKEKPETVLKVVKAMNAALADMHANPGKTAKLAAELFSKAEPEVVDSAVKSLLEVGIFPKNCMVSAVGWDSNVGLIKLTKPDSKAANVTFDQIADMSFCKKAMGE